MSTEREPIHNQPQRMQCTFLIYPSSVFLRKLIKETQVLQQFCKTKSPRAAATRCKSTLNLLNTVNEYRPELFKLLMMSLNIQRTGTLEQIHRHMAVLRFKVSLNVSYFLRVSLPFVSHTDILHAILQT
jgi:hypothetical protein